MQTAEGVLSIVCPVCGAGGGERCFTNNGLAALYHEKRLMEAPVSSRYMGLERETYHCGANPTYNCRNKKHSSCSGYHPRNHGMPGLPCTCSCHRHKNN